MIPRHQAGNGIRHSDILTTKMLDPITRGIMNESSKNETRRDLNPLIDLMQEEAKILWMRKNLQNPFHIHESFSPNQIGDPSPKDGETADTSGDDSDGTRPDMRGHDDSDGSDLPVDAIETALIIPLPALSLEEMVARYVPSELPSVRELTPVEIDFLSHVRLYLSQLDPVQVATAFLPILTGNIPLGGLTLAAALVKANPFNLQPNSPGDTLIMNPTLPIPTTVQTVDEPWYRSRRVWISIVAGGALVLSFLKIVTIDSETQAAIADYIPNAIEMIMYLIAGALALWSRLKPKPQETVKK